MSMPTPSDEAFLHKAGIARLQTVTVAYNRSL